MSITLWVLVKMVGQCGRFPGTCWALTDLFKLSGLTDIVDGKHLMALFWVIGTKKWGVLTDKLGVLAGRAFAIWDLTKYGLMSNCLLLDVTISLGLCTLVFLSLFLCSYLVLLVSGGHLGLIL